MATTHDPMTHAALLQLMAEDMLASGDLDAEQSGLIAQIHKLAADLIVRAGTPGRAVLFGSTA